MILIAYQVKEIGMCNSCGHQNRGVGACGVGVVQGIV